MSVLFQCSRCQEKIGLDEKFVGRKIVCPMCETRLIVPEPESDPLFVEQDIALALEHFKLTAWDKAFARKALENDFVKSDALHVSVTRVRRAMQKGLRLTINEDLLARKAITPEHALIAKKLVKALPGAGELAGEALAECPNCFETIRANATKCPYCGQRTGDLTVSAMCPACKREQGPGRRFCVSCGADMKTGLRPGAREKVCPRCGELEREGSPVCRACGEDLSRTPEQVVRADSARRVKQWIADHSVGIAAAVIVIVAGLAWTKREGLKLWLFGADRAALEARVERFDEALRQGALDVLAEMLDPELPKGKCEAGERLRAAILGCESASTFVKDVKSIRHEKTVFAPGARSARIYVETSGRLNDGEGLAARVAWKWVMRDGVWYYLGPLP